MKSLDNREYTGVLGIVTLKAPNFNTKFDIQGFFPAILGKGPWPKLGKSD